MNFAEGKTVRNLSNPTDLDVRDDVCCIQQLGVFQFTYCACRPIRSHHSSSEHRLVQTGPCESLRISALIFLQMQRVVEITQ